MKVKNIKNEGIQNGDTMIIVQNFRMRLQHFKVK